MKIKCLKNVCASGVGLEAGKTYDLSSADASFLISIGKAEEYKETPKPKKQQQKSKCHLLKMQQHKMYI